VTTRFIVLRHGETFWNIESRIQGHRDSELTPAGIAQARALGERMRGERFDLLVASDLGRALSTAGHIGAVTGHSVIPDARLRERNFGDCQGFTYGELDLKFPNLFSSIREVDPDFPVPGGETRRQFHDRVKAAFEALAREHEGKRLAVVSHGGVLAMLYRAIHAIPLGTPHPIPIRNASYNALAWDGGTWTVEAWGDTLHLPAGEAFNEL
jgi:2,3-bisphosphoglycerate-dependent phosphoglycerate mutase